VYPLSKEEKHENWEHACAVKLDMANTYDRVDWSCLKGILQKLGFQEQVVNLIMSGVVTSVSFSVHVNGVLSDVFTRHS
jgi:hypothetical protein